MGLKISYDDIHETAVVGEAIQVEVVLIGGADDVAVLRGGDTHHDPSQGISKCSRIVGIDEVIGRDITTNRVSRSWSHQSNYQAAQCRQQQAPEGRARWLA